MKRIYSKKWFDDWFVSCKGSEFEVKLPNSFGSEKSITIKGKYTLKHVKWLFYALDSALSTLTQYDKRIQELEEQKDNAYYERNQLVVALSKIFKSYLGFHPKEDKEWEDDWRVIVFIELPTGQATWHIHDSERKYFEHLDFRSEAKWDGHSTEEKYNRLRDIEGVKK